MKPLRGYYKRGRLSRIVNMMLVYGKTRREKYWYYHEPRGRRIHLGSMPVR